MRHALVIGGTGMLARATDYLAATAEVVTVVARRPEPYCDRQPTATPMRCDYTDYTDDGFAAAIDDRCQRVGFPELTLCWMHGRPERVRAVAATVGSGAFVHVLGSAYGHPSGRADELRSSFDQIAGLDYRQLILGFQIERGRSRWLTHSEISGSAIEAIRGSSGRVVAGVLTPWEMRP